MKKYILVLALLLAACPPPGKGRKARAYYKKCDPMIEALEKYHQKYQSYPEQAIQLVPEFLDTMTDPNLYEKTEDSYSISFSYSGPGINRCRYTPKTKWVCHGYF